MVEVIRARLRGLQQSIPLEQTLVECHVSRNIDRKNRFVVQYGAGSCLSVL